MTVHTYPKSFTATENVDVELHERPKEKTLQVSGTFAGTLLWKGSNNGTSWVTLVSTTVPGGWENNAPWKYTSLDYTHTSGQCDCVEGYSE